MKLMATFEALAQAIPVKQQRNGSFLTLFQEGMCPEYWNLPD